MGYLCIAAPLLANGFDVQIIDQRVSQNFDRELTSALADHPAFVGLSVITGRQILYSLEIARKIKAYATDIPVVFGGVHPSLMPEQTLKNPLIDIIVRGEGEDTVLELADALLNGTSLHTIQGISYKVDGGIKHNPDRPCIDLNAQPSIPYHLVSVDNYLMGQIPGYRRSLDVYTSRGCPCACYYCYNQSFNKRRWRPINTDRIVCNINELISNYNIDSLFFNDDNMFVKLPRVYEICQAMIDELPYVPTWGSVGSRVDALIGCDYDILEKSGCKHLYIGIESGSDKILDKIKKGITLHQTRDVVRDLSKTGIVPHYNFMTGYPDETPEDLDKTLSFIDEILTIDPRAYISSLHIITPYPGTPFYHQAVEMGWNAPQNLEDWADIYWEKTDVPWLTTKMRHKLSNISVVSYFIDHKVADRLQGRPVFLAGVWLYTQLAKFRWRRRLLHFAPEFQLLKRLNEWNILE